MEIETNKQRKSAILRENAPIIIIISIILISGVVAVLSWHYLELTNQEQSVDKFETKVDGLIKNVNKEAAQRDKEVSSTDEQERIEKELAVNSNPFSSPLKKRNKVDKNNSSTSSKKSVKGATSTKVKKRIANKVRVLGLLGGPGKRLAIIGIGNNVQIVKPGDSIASLIIKDINQKRVIIEEYGKELTYTFGGGQD